ncbi:hypothetical protein CK203_035476 [Vitis vinifera]|uniref:CCHC-type domain-containing protein n=1 Tax=Vitis vinifera TaxID=29760 RepID=A0A438I3M7_VITVI|nr:hypothetical protein CK203_035476 [Vitis vinifera]
MEGETIKIMNQDLVRLDRFDGSNFTRWQDKVRFLLTTLKIFYILDPTLAPLPEPKENDTPQVVAARKKREEDELICLPSWFYCGLNYHQVGKVTGRGFSTRVKITPWKRFKNIFALRKNRDQETKWWKSPMVGLTKPMRFQKANHPRGKNNKRNSGNYMSPKKNQEQFKGKKGPCFVCGKPRHYARECRYRNDQKGAVVNAIDEEIITTLSDVCVVQGKVQGWWYDTCATVHVTYDKSLFKTFEDAKGDQEVQMGNEGRSKVLARALLKLLLPPEKGLPL